MRSILTMLILVITALQALADKVVVLENAQESVQARAHLLMQAKKTIDVQYFTIENDQITVGGLALIRAAAREGAIVRIIVDSMHNLMTKQLMAALMENLDAQSAKNIQIKEFNGFNLFHPLCYTRRMHDKSLIIDGKYLIVGDRNIANGYFDVGTKDKNGLSLPIYQGIDVLIEGEKAAAQATKYFNDRWISKDVKPVHLYSFSAEQLDINYCKYQQSESNSGFQCESNQEYSARLVKQEIARLDEAINRIRNGQSTIINPNMNTDYFANAYETDDVEFIHDEVIPGKRVCKGKTENSIGNKLYKAIEQNTTQSLIVTTPYLVVTPQMEELVIKLAGKGVNVRFVTNSMISNDVPSAHQGYLKTREKLLNAGVKIYEYESIVRDTSTIETLHAKTVLMDSKKVFIGSYNWDYRSQNLNSEVGILIGLDGSKFTSPTSDVRSRIAGILRKAKLVKADGQLDSTHTVETDFSELDSKELIQIINSRKEANEQWKGHLENRLYGDFLLKQL